MLPWCQVNRCDWGCVCLSHRENWPCSSHIILKQGKVKYLLTKALVIVFYKEKRKEGDTVITNCMKQYFYSTGHFRSWTVLLYFWESISWFWCGFQFILVFGTLRGSKKNSKIVSTLDNTTATTSMFDPSSFYYWCTNLGPHRCGLHFSTLHSYLPSFTPIHLSIYYYPSKTFRLWCA